MPAKKTTQRKRRRTRRRYGRFYRYGNRRMPVISTPWSTLVGYGGYKSKYNKLLKQYNELESNCPTTFGARAGAFIGNQAQKYITHLTGLGDYSIKQNSLYHGTDPPMIANTPGGEEVIVRHREFLGDLNSGPLDGAVTEFDLNYYAINPGNTKLFPFLANIAANYQEWELRGMVVELKSLSSEYASNSVLGSYFVGTQYNALNPPPNNKRELENLEYSTSGKPSESIIHGIECARHLNVDTHLYVAIDSNYESGDKRFYDLGNLYIGSAGLNVPNAPIAEIWVSYECALYKPQLQAPITKTWLFQKQGTSIVDETPFGGPVGTILEPAPGSYGGITAQVSSSNAQILNFEFPAIEATYLLNMYWTNVSPVTVAVTWDTEDGVSLTPTIFQPTGGGQFTAGSYYNNNVAGSGQHIVSGIVSINPQSIGASIQASVNVVLSNFIGDITNGLMIVVSSWNPKIIPDPF